MRGNFLTPLLFLFPKTRHSQLARQVQYLKAENAILRARLPAHIHTTPDERRRLLKYGKALGPALLHIITIVTYATFLRWKRDGRGHVPVQTGRPKVSRDLIATVLMMARDNKWGYSRILGELKKLRFDVSRSTVRNILRAEGFYPRPKNEEDDWNSFLRRHALTLWSCDFLSKKIWTRCGMLDCYILFFIHLGTRKVHVAGITYSPDRQWMNQQARNISMLFDEQKVKPTILFRDGDGKFGKEFDDILKTGDVTVRRLPPYSPDLNAYAERWVQSVKYECLNHFIVFGIDHLRYLTEEYAKYYNTVRPHQGMNNLPLSTDALSPPGPPPKHHEVYCTAHLGGFLKHYYRRAA